MHMTTETWRSDGGLHKVTHNKAVTEIGFDARSFGTLCCLLLTTLPASSGQLEEAQKSPS